MFLVLLSQNGYLYLLDLSFFPPFPPLHTFFLFCFLVFFFFKAPILLTPMFYYFQSDLFFPSLILLKIKVTSL